jgi:acetyltransferase-like isoleucine patch superfamily enzyme
VKAFLVARDHPIAPFGEPARDAAIGGQTLAAHHDELCRRLGLTPQRVPDAASIPDAERPCLVWHDDLFVTHRALRGFVRAARRGGQPARLALPDSLLMQRYHPLQELTRDERGRWLFDLWWLPRGGVDEGLRAAVAVEPPFKEIAHRVRAPRHIVGFEHYVHPVTTTIALRVRHWVHILWANNLMPQVRLVERITGQPLGTLWRALASLGSLPRLQRLLTYRGRRCRIHPTARVELSVLGDDVEIGPFALVRGAVVGSGTVIEDRVDLQFTCLGPGSFVSRNSVLIMCAGYPDADMCVNGMQFALCGRRTALTSFVRPMDMRLGAPVSVVDGERVVELPGHLLGPCFGHDVFVGPDVAIHPGRAIPNGCRILPAPGDGLSRVPAQWPAGQLATVRDGRLIPIA